MNWMVCGARYKCWRTSEHRIQIILNERKKTDQISYFIYSIGRVIYELLWLHVEGVYLLDALGGIGGWKRWGIDLAAPLSPL